MADVKQWITIKGRHIPIFEGETKEDAIKRIKENTKKGPAIKKATVKKKPVPKKEIVIILTFFKSRIKLV